MTERTADDHWDLASSVGATATMVAASRALASRAADPLIDDPFAEALVRAVGLPYFVKLLDGENPSGDPEHDPQQSANHIATRTRFYDDIFLDATRGGVTQAVILARGQVIVADRALAFDASVADAAAQSLKHQQLAAHGIVVRPVA